MSEFVSGVREYLEQAHSLVNVCVCVPPDTKGPKDAQQTVKLVLTVQCGGGSE